MRLSALALALTATSMLAGPAISAAGAQRLVASRGWQLEFFGQDVAVLRTALTAPASGRTGQILLSCEGTDRRVRITLPDFVPRRSAADTDGMAMIKPPAGTAPGLRPAVSRFVLERDRVLTFIETGRPNGDATLQLVKLLATLPTRLELLIHFGSSPITIRGVLPYSVSLAFDRPDAIAFAGFVSACRERSG